jgi:hypothetical protein
MAACEHDTDGPGRSVEAHTYRLSVQAPKVIGEGTAWFTLVPPVSYSEICSYTTSLRQSMLDFGFDQERVDAWFEHFVRCTEYKTTITKERELPLTL